MQCDKFLPLHSFRKGEKVLRKCVVILVFGERWKSQNKLKSSKKKFVRIVGVIIFALPNKKGVEKGVLKHLKSGVRPAGSEGSQPYHLQSFWEGAKVLWKYGSNSVST